MHPRKLITLALLFSLLVFTNSLSAAKKKTPPDMRNMVTAVDHTKHTLTVTSMYNKVAIVYQMANPEAYPNEVIINGVTKTFTAITAGLEYVASTEVAPNILQSITLRTADAGPKLPTAKKPATPKTPSTT